MITSAAAPASPSQDEISLAATRPKGMDRTKRTRIQKLFRKEFYETYFAVEKVMGPDSIQALFSPFIAIDLAKRRGTEYADFVRIRKALPDSFWKGLSAREHFFNMIRNWHESIGVTLCYESLGSAAWRERFTVVGTPPNEHPEWGKRPVVMPFMHTGVYALSRFWMRSNGYRFANLFRDLPPIVETEYFQKCLVAGDKKYGLEGVPHLFHTSNGLRDSIRFLKPGNILTLALDVGTAVTEEDRYTVSGFPFYLKQGACRLAMQTNAIVIPLAFRRIGTCRFEVRYGKPVPDELLKKEDLREAMQFLAEDMWPDLEKHPVDLNWTTLESLAPHIQVKRTGWP